MMRLTGIFLITGPVSLGLATPALASDMVVTCYLSELVPGKIKKESGNFVTTGDHRLLVLQFPAAPGRHEVQSAKYWDPTNLMLNRRITAVRIDSKAIGVETQGATDDEVTLVLGAPEGADMTSTTFLSHAGAAVKQPIDYVGHCKPLMVSNPDDAFASFQKMPATRK